LVIEVNDDLKSFDKRVERLDKSHQKLADVIADMSRDMGILVAKLDMYIENLAKSEERTEKRIETLEKDINDQIEKLEERVQKLEAVPGQKYGEIVKKLAIAFVLLFIGYLLHGGVHPQ